MSGKLLPCPFCGEFNARVDDAGDMPLGHGQYQKLFVVHCGCGVEGTTSNTPAIAIEEWNRRASPPPQATGAPVDVERIMALAEKMMRDSWATGDDSSWHPARDELRAALASPEGSQHD